MSFFLNCSVEIHQDFMCCAEFSDSHSGNADVIASFVMYNALIIIIIITITLLSSHAMDKHLELWSMHTNNI